MRCIRICTYNIHASTGRDGRYDPERIADVLINLNSDIIALQEVDTGYKTESSLKQLKILSDMTGMNYIEGPAMRRDRGSYGNAILFKLPHDRIRRYDISVKGREPRSILSTCFTFDNTPFRFINTHLGLKLNERRRQTAVLMEILKKDPIPTILAGDFNEVFPFNSNIRKISQIMDRELHKKTFPSWFPLIAPDRIWLRNKGLTTVTVYRVKNAQTRMASDHLPLCAVFEPAMPGNAL